MYVMLLFLEGLLYRKYSVGGLYHTYIWVYQGIICTLHVAKLRGMDHCFSGGERALFCFCSETQL